MRIRYTSHQNTFTGQLPKPILISNMRKRVNQIKYKASSKSFVVRKSQANMQIDRTKIQSRNTIQAQNDVSTTNFWPPKTEGPLIVSANNLQSQNSFVFNKRSQDSRITRLSRPQSHSIQTRSRFRGSKYNLKQGRGIDAVTYQKQIKYFEKLYQLLANVLASIKTGLQDVQKTVSQYGRFIRDPYLAFIDDFTEGTSQKIRKTIRMCRIHQYMSIAYLFLQIAQQRIYNNQSYLVNFIGYCLSNLIFTARIYILIQKKSIFEDNQFEKSVQRFETQSYGHPLTNMEDVLLRVQHNNQIITMIHKKLGVYNQKFQQCIRVFLKNAQRRKYTTCLCAHYIFQYLAMHIHQSQLVGISEFLQVSPTPYLAPQKHQYTLVFEPLGIIKDQQYLRPYLLQFVKWASKHFDLVLWTWQMPSQLQSFVQQLDPYLFSKLYRYHCIIKDQIYTKDLNRLGRNLKKTLIIDYDERIYADTPKNGFVSRWRAKKSKDKGLLVICQILQEMIGSQSEVEDMLTFYKQQIYSLRGF